MLAFGSVGDVLPYAALATGLASRGYRVRFVTHARFAGQLQAQGLDVGIVDTDPQNTLTTPSGRKLLESGASPLAFGIGLVRILKPILEQITLNVQEECRNTDAIICSGLALFIAPHVAEKLKRPCIPAFLQPVTPTSAFPNAFVSGGRWSGTENRISHFVYWRGSWALFRPLVNRIRKRILGLPGLSLLEPYSGLHRQGAPILYGYSPHVLPKPSDWRDWTHVAGYWFTPSLSNWHPPKALVEFLMAGPAPLCVGFGSMSSHETDRTYSCLLSALKRTGHRAIFLTGWGKPRLAELPDHVLPLEFAPHEWLLPKTAAVIHHGGAGTTAAALRAGIPSVIVPFLGDQFFWGRLLQRLGVGGTPIPHLNLDDDNLSAAIAQVTADESFRTRANSLGARISGEGGIEQGVEAVRTSLERMA